MTLDEVKANLSGLLHGGSADDLTEVALMLKRSGDTLLSKIDPIDTMRLVALSSVVYDDVYNYALPSDFKSLVDLIPQDNRNQWDKAYRTPSGVFDLNKAMRNKVVSIEGSEGSKIIRINWRSRQGKVLNTMDSLTSNGTWIVVGSATGLKANSIFKKSGSASIEFDLVASGDGISNIGMTPVDMTNEDGVSDQFVWYYFGSIANLNSITGIWGNDITTKFWTSVAQTTQADGTPFKVGWNLVKFPWSTATQTGTVAPSTIDSFKTTIQATGAISNIRVDNIMFSIGRNFDIKYYSKYILKNSSGTWIEKTTGDTDVCVLDDDAIQIYNLENLIAASQQSENNLIDVTWAKGELNGRPDSPDPVERMGLYAKYRAQYPSQSKKEIAKYGGSPARGRW